jgi:outer membrane protein TolC
MRNSEQGVPLLNGQPRPEMTKNIGTCCGILPLSCEKRPKATIQKGTERSLSDKLNQLYEERLQVTKRILKTHQDNYLSGIGNIESLVEAEKDVLHSILDYPAATHEQKLEAARTMTDSLKELEGVTKARVKSGISTQCELDRVQVSRVDAEIQLEKLKAHKRSLK